MRRMGLAIVLGLLMPVLALAQGQHPQNPTLRDLPNNTLLDLGVLPCTSVQGESASDCRKVSDFSGMTYDSDRHRIVAFGGGHASTLTDVVFDFNPTTLQWTELGGPPTTCDYARVQGNFDSTIAAWKPPGTGGPYPRKVTAHTYDLLHAPPGKGGLYVLGRTNGSAACQAGAGWEMNAPNSLAKYVYATNTWEFNTQGVSWASGIAGTEYDPITKLIWVADRNNVHTFNLDTQVQVTCLSYTQGTIGIDPTLIYYPPNGNFYLFSGTSTGESVASVWRLVPNRADCSKSTLTKLAPTGTAPPAGGRGPVYDAANRLFVGWFRASDNRAFAYNPETNAWSSQVMQGGPITQDQAFFFHAYDPVNNVHIFKTLSPEHKVWAYKWGRTGIGVPVPMLGDCSNETGLAGRTDIVYCEQWEDSNWWSERKWYNASAGKTSQQLASASDVAKISIDTVGCVAGNCAKIHTPDLSNTGSNLHWLLQTVGLQPEALHLRYYLKLGPTWNPNTCNISHQVTAAGGKFPGFTDIRVPPDPSGQCGNGGNPGDGINCWSNRANFRSCNTGAGGISVCTTKTNPVTRMGEYLYFYNQENATGSAGHWDTDWWAQFRGDGGTCETVANNVFCTLPANERGTSSTDPKNLNRNYGVLERSIWYRIERQAKMNTPGDANGIIRAWVDGELAYEKLNHIYRLSGHDNLHVRTFWLNVFHGGTDGACNDQDVWMDQLVLAHGVVEGAPIIGIPPAAPTNLRIVALSMMMILIAAVFNRFRQ